MPCARFASLVAVRLTLFAVVGLAAGCASQPGWPPQLTISRIDTRPRSSAPPIADFRDKPQTSEPSAIVAETVDDGPSSDLPAVPDAAAPDVTDDDVSEILLSEFGQEPTPLSTENAEPPIELTQSGVLRFEVPEELPGSDVAPLDVPEYDPDQPAEERRAAIERLYAPLPALPASEEFTDDAPRWTLAELEQVAWENHPALAQAAAQVEVARGGMIQAGLYPNPTVGYEADTVNTLGTAGYHGAYLEQQIITGGKLKLAQCAAAMEFENAQIAYQRTKIDISTRVRDAYYRLIVAQRRRTMLTALAKLTDGIYRAQIDLVAGGQVAAYEPLQVRVFAVQARNTVISAENDAIAAGRRLGAAAGMEDVERFALAGTAEESPPEIGFLAAKIHLLECHTDLRTVRNQVVQAQYRSRLEYIRPRIPDLSIYSAVQKDYTGPPFGTTWNLQVGAPIPVFNQNQGNVLATYSAVQSREREFGATQNRLIGELAAALARYDTARTLAGNYRNDILPDQVQTYRGVYRSYRVGGQGANGNLNFSDVIVAQQTLNAAVNEYADVLTEMWQSYVDVAALMQVEDLTMLEAWFGAMP